jgi:electron transfer flavoprotein alpha subunit
MAILVVAEHSNSVLKPATLNAVTAAVAIGGEIHVLIAGSNARPAAEAAAKAAGVTKVLLVDAPAYEHPLAEVMGPLVAKLAKSYSHVLSPATTSGKNFMPRVAAELDVAQISEISSVVSPDTFVRPIYAGNALATVQSKDAIKIITVRGTGFAAAAAEGGNAAIETIEAGPAQDLSQFVSQELSKSARPERRPASSSRAAVACSRVTISICWKPWPTSSGPPSGRRAPPSMPASCRMTIRSGRPARSWRRIFISPSAFPVPFSTLPA